MAKNPKKIHPVIQFLILMGLFVGALLGGVIVSMVLIIVLYGEPTLTQSMAFNTLAPHVVTSIWILQILSTTFPLFVAPFIFGKMIMDEPGEYLKPRINIPAIFFLMVIAIMFVSSPFMEYIVSLNQKMVLPEALKGVQQWMREKEDLAQKQTEALLQMKTIGNMLFDLLVVGLLTAIAEEFFFRGAMQTIFTRWTKSYHWAIWITAIIFSAIHVEFFGFVPRMVLGVFFGYFVVWSGSIWAAVLGHFINNGSAVVLTYLFQQKIISFDPDSDHYNYIVALLSLIFTVLLFFIYRKTALKKSQLPGDNSGTPPFDNTKVYIPG